MDPRLTKVLRGALRAERSEWRFTPVTIIHTAVPTSGSNLTETFVTGDTTEFEYLRSGAVAMAPAEGRDYLHPGGFVPMAAGRVVFDGLGTGADGHTVRELFTGAESMHSGYRTVEVTVVIDGREYLPGDISYTHDTDELLVGLSLKENV